MTAREEKEGKVKEGKEKEIRIKIKKKKAEQSELATSLFDPVEKNPYYLYKGNNGIAVKNLIELNNNLDSFAGDDALWLASWIEYLGDKDTADRIRKAPGEFKEIIAVRYEELREFTNK
jgi:hypothetical protein